MEHFRVQMGQNGGQKGFSVRGCPAEILLRWGMLGTWKIPTSPVMKTGLGSDEEPVMVKPSLVPEPLGLGSQRTWPSCTSAAAELTVPQLGRSLQRRGRPVSPLSSLLSKNLFL